MARRTIFSIFFSITLLTALALYISFNPLNTSWEKLRSQFANMFTISQSNIALSHDEQTVVSNHDLEDLDEVKQNSNDTGDHENNFISTIIDKIEQNINVIAARKLDYILVDKNLLTNYAAFTLNISKIVTKFAMDIDYSTELNILMSSNRKFSTEIDHIITQLSKYNNDYLSIDHSADHQKSSALGISNVGCTGCVFKIQKYNYNLTQKNFDRQQIIKQLDMFQNYFYDHALLMKFIDE